VVTYVFIKIVQLVPGFLVGGLHEGLGHLRCGISAALFYGRKEGLGLGGLCTFLRLLLATSIDRLELSRCVNVVKLCSELYEAI
jgi:hypothetical protein